MTYFRRWTGVAGAASLAIAAGGPEVRASAPLPAPNPLRLAQQAAQPEAKASEAAKQPATPAAVAAPAKPAQHTMPAPRPGALALERAHVERYDAALKAAREHAISAEDLAKVLGAAQRIAASDLNAARALREQIADPVARKLTDWLRLRAGFGEAAEYRQFMEANPAWVDRTTLVQRYEEAIFVQGGSAGAIKSHFPASRPPRTGAGYAALASALLADGDEAGAQRLARTGWREHEIAATLEAGFLERFGKLLTQADHKWRFDRVTSEDPRWSNERGERAAVARRILPLLSEGERKKAEARMAVFSRAANAGQLLAALPEAKDDAGLAFHRVQHMRRAGKIEEAAKLVLATPPDPGTIASLDGWWTERRALVYELLKAGNARLAYQLARDAGPLSPNPLKDQTFMAGWLALSHLKDAKAALPHFEALARAADGPLSHSRARYWLARAQEAVGARNEAQASNKAAAQHIDTFHGQLARARLGAGADSIELKPPAAPTADQVAAFSRLDAVRGAVVARRAGLDRGVIRALLGALERFHKSEAEVAMVAHLADSLGDTQMAVRIGKSGVARGFNLIVYSYPLHPFPAFTPLRTPTPEMALLLGVARQESEFNGQTVSGAGARGILQVMPITARHVCRDYKIKCDLPRLMTDDSYNTTLASAYIGDRMGEFQGSYVLGIAGYNAGPGRARQWVREFGDPRDPKVDAIDWIHRIPFEETREYVQKVLSNVGIYRARLSEGATRIRVAEDLARARGARAADDPKSTPEPERGSGGERLPGFE